MQIRKWRLNYTVLHAKLKTGRQVYVHHSALPPPQLSDVCPHQRESFSFALQRHHYSSTLTMGDIAKKVTKLLEDRFERYPLKKPLLENYEVSSASVLGGLWRKDVRVPVDPVEKNDSKGWASSKFPMLLLHC